MDFSEFATTPIQDVAKLTGLEFLRRLADGRVPPAPFLQLIGAELATVEEGRVVFKSTPGLQHYNPLGVAHGGYASTLLDSAMGCAIQTLCAVGIGNMTLELKVNLVRAITKDVGALTIEGSVLHRGRNITTSEGRITDAKGKLYAHASCTCMMVPIG
jgi:uncharacterized protein (TIGR00369 family)